MPGSILFRLADHIANWRNGLAARPPARGVLLVAAGGLGDTVLLAAVFSRLAALAESGEKITLLLRRDAAKMAFLLAPEAAITAVDFARLAKSLGYRRQVFHDLFHAHYRLVVSVDYLRHPMLDEALIGACQAAETVAMEPRPWAKYDRQLNHNRRLYDRLFDSGPTHLDKVVRWSRFADWLAGADRPPPVIGLAPDLIPPPAKLAAPTVFIQPYSAVKEKQSPAALYRRIIAALPQGFEIVVTGAPGDPDANPEFNALIEMPNVTFDSSSFEELVPRLRAARLVISVDTALMHLAVAVGAPTLCLASAAYIGEIVPYGPEISPANVHFIFEELDCAGCLGDCRLPAENGLYPCVARISADRVLARVGELLDLESGP